MKKQFKGQGKDPDLCILIIHGNGDYYDKNGEQIKAT